LSSIVVGGQDVTRLSPGKRNIAMVFQSYAPPSGPQFETPSGPSVRATVKWYNPEKGFGFVQLADGSGDAFLHVSVAERSGPQQRTAGRDA
jgi:cold shock CspA family protein